MRQKNKIELIGIYGSDEIIACSAWTSTSRNLTNDKRNRIPKMLEDLWKNGHETPFEKGIVHFLVDSEIASHIHMLKHRISSINGECLEKNTLIYFENKYGRINKKYTIEELYNKFTNGRSHQNTDRDKIYSQNRIKNLRVRVLNEDTNEFEYSHIKDIWKTDIKKIYKITLNDGKSIMCSDNHPFLTKTGYLSIKDGLNSSHSIGCNGVSINIKNKPWTFKSFFNESKDYTRKEFALINNLKYELIKKWGYIFEVEFKKDENKDFKKGNKPWNYEKAGSYKIDIKNRKHNPLKGEDCHFWRGGISSDRESIGAWTTNNAKKVHEKYNYTCQQCGCYSCNLDAHHIVPVCQNIDLAMDFDNLISVCKKCHKEIHKSILNEVSFSEKILNQSFIPKNNFDKKSSKYLHYVGIKSIEFVKEEECYDIEIEGRYKNFVANGIVTHNSARYKELKEDKYYLPEDWIGIYPKEPNTLNEYFKGDWFHILEKYTELGNKLYHQCLSELTPVLGRKRAKESARFFKTYNSQIEVDIMFNMRSFANFLNLRKSKEAQKEIRDIATEMYNLLKDREEFKHTLNIITKYKPKKLKDD